MIFAILFIFFISLSASYALDTNSSTNITNNDNSAINKDISRNNSESTVKNSNDNKNNKANTTKTNTKYQAAGEPEKLTQNQILAASKTVNNYVKKYKKLPNYVTIAGFDFSMQEYLYLLSGTIYYKYNKKTTQIAIRYNIKNPSSPNGVNLKGKLTKAQYYSYAKILINYVKKYNKIPNYINTRLGKMQYQTVIYTFNKILYYSATHKGALASNVAIKIAKSQTLNKNLPKFERGKAKNPTTNNPSSGTSSGTSSGKVTISQSLIWAASTSLKSYVNKNKKLPNYVTISGKKYSIPEFLYLLSKAINTKLAGSSGAITVKSGVKSPSSASGSSISKIFTKAQYNDMAKRFVNYINSNNRAPNYLAAKYGVGNIQYQTAIYGLVCVGDYINTKKAIPKSLTIKIAKSNSINKYLPVYSGNNENTNQTATIKTTLLGSNDKGKVELIGVFGNPNSKIKIAYVIGQHPLESQVHNVLYELMNSKKNSLKYCYYIYKITVTKNPSDYTEGRMNGQLLAQSYVLPHIINNDYNLVIDMHSNRGLDGGSYEETQFIFAPLNHTISKIIAENLINQIPALTYYYPNSQTSPSYLTQPLVNAGIPTILFETYINENVSVTTDLVNQLISKVDVYNFASNSTDSSGALSLDSIIDAASRVKAYVEANGVLPNFVTIGTTQYSMPNFLYLLSTAIKNIAAGSTSGVKPISVSAAATPSGAKISKTLSKADYVDIAKRVSSYITTNKRAPNYASSDFGNIQFQSLVYELSKVLNYVNINGVLPSTLAINTNNPSTLNGGSNGGIDLNGPLNEKNTLSASELLKYLKATTNCQVNDNTIKNLAASLTKNCNSDLEKATAIFNYVKNNIDYTYYTNTKKGAVKTLSSKSGNCVDQSHLLIALLRSAGLASRYVHADCTFTVSGRIGHVFVQVLIGDTWIVADTTHSANSLGKITNWNTNTYTLKGDGKSASIGF
ncbi:transglutaminase domain-containing protein [Methanobrevibacter sp. TMH8]|uniref:pseudomurein-binding repeat-containing protein n=1 Tax=Methanobrevibacter sp. TMH8 TaxID=2848611 RepID=UPI001CCA4F2E|nr:transglutaminase domain-containing protein [Methanobrevibacter sp. TMH8]MBZ9571033.1 transglutaminase domain-containing protein [Methanobrevibacter sp. TMH8]